MASSPPTLLEPDEQPLGRARRTHMMPSQVHMPYTPDSDSDDALNHHHDKTAASSRAAKHLKHALEAHRAATRGHLDAVLDHNRRLQDLSGRPSPHPHPEPVVLSGDDLSLAELVAVASHKVPVQITNDQKVLDRVNRSVSFLKQHLDQGNVVYGINTGYGGSADTRSADFLSMQRALIQHHNSAVLLSSDLQKTTSSASSSSADKYDTLAALDKHHLPRPIVRAAMLTRCNSLMRGHSAVRLSIIDAIATLLNRDFVPVIPLRGSISACGDLTPLSYIAGALEGNTDIYLDCGLPDGRREILNAKEALTLAGLVPTVMMPKEGLGLMNGTAVSCAAAGLALHETHYLALASQVLTGMCTEALGGSLDNFHPFISGTRPHQGQAEVARNVTRYLENSHLVVGKDTRRAGLYQDRYALRTAPQWIGPQLEDLSLAAKQLGVELNSTTDNPLIDADEGHVHHGGNFQAVSVTSAMEKARLALQMLGKLMFAQCSELINPMLNNALTPNLCFDDPGVSFTFKGVDINMAAYMSELAYLANPVSSHVQSAEMHNQAVNSLALISARYTLGAVELVSLMTAAHLYTVCQALDLHVLYIEYAARIEAEAHGLFTTLFQDDMPKAAMEHSWQSVHDAILAGLKAGKSQDTPLRARAAADATIVPITKTLFSNGLGGKVSLSGLDSWTTQLTSLITTAIRETRVRLATETDSQQQTTLQYLGRGSSIIYRYIRHQLGIPLHKGLLEHPTYPDSSREGISIAEADKLTIGTRIGTIYEALRSGAMRHVLLTSLAA